MKLKYFFSLIWVFCFLANTVVAEERPTFATAKALFEAGFSEFMAGDYTASINHFDQVNEIVPDSASYYFKGYALFKTNDLEHALLAFKKAYEIDPNYSPRYLYGPNSDFPLAKITQENDKEKVHAVVEESSLWDIALRQYGEPSFWPKLWVLNSGVSNPKRVLPGTQLVLVKESVVQQVDVVPEVGTGTDLMEKSLEFVAHQEVASEKELEITTEKAQEFQPAVVESDLQAERPVVWYKKPWVWGLVGGAVAISALAGKGGSGSGATGTITISAPLP